jgi:hypothetical protein
MAMTTVSNPTIEQAIQECLECLRWCSAYVDEVLTHDPSRMAIRLCHECAPSAKNTRIAKLCGNTPRRAFAVQRRAGNSQTVLQAYTASQ